MPCRTSAFARLSLAVQMDYIYLRLCVKWKRRPAVFANAAAPIGACGSD